MTMDYAHVTNNEIDRHGLPDVWRHADGSTTSNYRALDAELWAADGWLPVTEIRPELSGDEYHGAPEYTVDGDTITATYPAVTPDPPEPTEIDELKAQIATLTALIQGGANGD